MQPFLGIPAWACMVLLVIPIILYTYLGGFRAIVTTDMVQFLIMAVFMVLLTIAAIVAASKAGEGSIIAALKNASPPWSDKGEVFNPFFLGIISALIGTMPLAVSLFMLVGIIACQMSTVDTFANVSAMALAYDIVEPALLKKKVSSERRLTFARYISIAAILAALVCAFISEKLGDVYYISSGVLSASIAVPALFIFWRKTTLPAMMTSSIAGFVGTVGGYWYEYKFLQAADPKAAHYYTDDLPAWLQDSYGYHYIVLGVILSVITIVAVSLVTKRTGSELLDNLKDAPIDNYNEFVASVNRS